MYNAVVVQEVLQRDESLEDEECSHQPSEVDEDQLRAILEADPHNYMRSCWRAQHWPICGRSAFEANWEGSSCLMSQPEIKKIIILKGCLLLFCATTMNYFLIKLWHTTNSGFYRTTRDDQHRGQTEKKLQSTYQSQSCAKKRSCSLFGDLLPIWSCSFLNSNETITSEKYSQQTVEMRWKLKHLQPAVVNRKGPTLLNNSEPHVPLPMLQKLNQLDTKFCLICHVRLTAHQRVTTSSISRNFCRESVSTTSRMQKMLHKNVSNPEAWISMLQE